MKEALIREWNSLELNDINSIRDYLLQHVLSRSNVPAFVREKILQVSIFLVIIESFSEKEKIADCTLLQVIAIMVKRGSITDQGTERRKLLGQVEQLIMSGELRKVCWNTAGFREYPCTFD